MFEALLEYKALTGQNDDPLLKLLPGEDQGCKAELNCSGLDVQVNGSPGRATSQHV